MKQVNDPCGSFSSHLSELLVLECDGSMIPIMTPNNEESEDQRKNKTNSWKEARLMLAHPHESKEIKFGCSYQRGVDHAGEQMMKCARLSGFKEGQTEVHVVSDGAVWIAHQVEKQLGADGHYLVDFYHICEYLAEAAPHCSADSDQWVEDQKEHLKQGRSQQVIEHLEPYLEADTVDEKQAPFGRVTAI